MKKRIKSILVVGGGSSGWMSASAFQKRFGKNCKVSLVESDKVSTVGVGESTIIGFNGFLKLLGLNDKDWMKECNAVYKNSIRFTNFARNDGSSFHYPFGGELTKQSISDWSVLAAKHKNLNDNSFCEYHNDNFHLAKWNKNTKNEDSILRNFNFDDDTAYHFDASLFGQFLKNKFKEVTRYVDDIVGVERDEDGYLTSVVGESGQKYTADLFVDCTGFRSLLLEKEMGSKFLSYKPWLSNDRAIAAHVPYKDKEIQLTNYTDCHALSSGWVWNIPLWNRIGTGYVYSSDFIDDDSAEKEFKKHLGIEDVEIHRKIQIRHGVRKQGWIKNVVGVGLAYAFVEPLESTGLISTHAIISQIIELLERKNFYPNGFDIDGYNYNAQLNMNGFRNFVSVHYKFSSREDTPYWKYQTREKDWWKPWNDEHNSEDFYTWSVKSSGVMFTNFYEMLHFFHSAAHVWPKEYDGVAYIMSGMGYKPIGDYHLDILRNSEDDDKSLDEIYEVWRRHVYKITEEVKKLPSSYQFMKRHIYS